MAKILTAYEMDGGPTGMFWEVFGPIEDGMPDQVSADDFGDYLDNVLKSGYDVLINTHESWIKMEEEND